MTDETKVIISNSIKRAATQLLGSELDGPFSVVSYPPGYNFFVVFGQPPYWNSATLGEIDQLCAEDESGIATLIGSRFSALYASILKNVVYKQSSADKQNLGTLQQKFGSQTKVAISAYEAAFGTVTQQQIDDSKCWPANKLGYIQYIVSLKYNDDPQQIPAIYASFASAYLQLISLGKDLNSIASRPGAAQEQLNAAITHTANPSAANGGWQTGESRFGVSYTGLPAVTAIVGSLATNDRKLTVTLELIDNGSPMSLDPPGIDQSRAGQTAIQLPKAMVHVELGKLTSAASQAIGTLSGGQSKIDMVIVYPGVTILQANPLELSADLTTGWYSLSILSDVAQKTGGDVSGFQLYGSNMKVSELFGQGKTFARVKTFVISREPTIQLTFYGADPDTIRNQFKQGEAAQFDVAGTLSYGSTSSGLNVQNVDVVGGNTVVTLAPPTITGTIPSDAQTAHVIGGVLDFPPRIILSPESGAITVKNSGGFSARFSVVYQQGGATNTEDSGDFPVLVAKTINLPADAVEIILTVKIATFVAVWSDVAIYRYDKPVTKSFELTGLTMNPKCVEI